MKARGSSVRFVLVSATVPNISDVASWIEDSNGGQAKTFEVRLMVIVPFHWDDLYSSIDAQFGEEYRPCKLTRFVYPIHKPKGSNDWVFASILDQKLFPILQQHSVNKPILVFCPTRKGETLMPHRILW
jgi:ATP-dependent DNA helicase HFM1/MER3